ncbi:MAG TPA: VTT domain-containing protein [Gemmatimonadales bacterium]|nr:VTT domain-containing protein [Gemmatimonadales bacterium]
MTDLLHFLESLPAGPLYGLIAALAAVENVFPPVPADTAVALGAFLAGRGIMDPWMVFGVTWTANVSSGAAVYALARRHGRALFQGVLGRRLFSDATIARIEEQYERHGTWGIFLSRLLPVWRGLVMPFAGIARVPAWRALLPLAAASAVYYGALTFLITTLGTNLEDVLRVVGRVNAVLGIVAAAGLVALAVWIVRRLKR